MERKRERAREGCFIITSRRWRVLSWSKGKPLPDLVLPDDFDEKEPLCHNYTFTYDVWALAGHGKKTNEKCGTFSSFFGCVRVELHDKMTLDGENMKGKVYVRAVFHSCHKVSCPVCYEKGWAPRLAGTIEYRLGEASKRFGQIEHVIVGIPSKFWALPYKQLKKKCMDALKSRGVIGGVRIFHGFRYNEHDHWFWSPHFHVLGIIAGGYKCRSCKKIKKTGKCGIENKGCDGFVNRNFRANEKDGIYLKVKGKRITVGGTAWYQLSHCTYDMTKPRQRVAVYFGVCSYRKLKLKKEDRKKLCPICQHEIVRLMYLGDNNKIWICCRKTREHCEHKEFKPPFVEGDRPVWSVDDREYRKKWGDYDDY